MEIVAPSASPSSLHQPSSPCWRSRAPGMQPANAGSEARPASCQESQPRARQVALPGIFRKSQAPVAPCSLTKCELHPSHGNVIHFLSSQAEQLPTAPSNLLSAPSARGHPQFRTAWSPGPWERCGHREEVGCTPGSKATWLSCIFLAAMHRVHSVWFLSEICMLLSHSLNSQSPQGTLPSRSCKPWRGSQFDGETSWK